MLKDILVNLANDDTLERDYLKVGWRDILLDHVKEIGEEEKQRIELSNKINKNRPKLIYRYGILLEEK